MKTGVKKTMAAPCQGDSHILGRAFTANRRVVIYFASLVWSPENAININIVPAVSLQFKGVLFPILKLRHVGMCQHLPP